MTETQQKLQTYEQMFAHRFSSEDHEYQQYVQRAADPPPTVDDWRGRGGGGGNQRGRDNRYQGCRGRGWGRGGGGPGYGEGVAWRAEHRGQQWQDRDRPWGGHSSGSGPPDPYQGSNPPTPPPPETTSPPPLIPDPSDAYQGSNPPPHQRPHHWL
ncbi:RNA guanine-N7 methyltransferase activating subunit-like [Sphaeramia orbicularis]|uniref:RNA guanine-N7 methyltransferase activating subunit-like n=1 Tax=Sphaeramia orbicularis TaxID=375764 RepID=UPI00117E2E4F|nr:RNA guanine-N7 methyltransferase activating subunit [Sphaeramia orbicularis]